MMCERKPCRCNDRRNCTVLCGLEGKPGITESRENQTDIYRDPRLYSMNY